VPEDLTNPTTLGVVGLLVIAVVALATSRWVIPLKHHADVCARYEERIADLVQDKKDLMSKLGQAVETNERALKVAQELSSRRRSSGGSLSS
jgi:hypothetical protein